MSHNPEVSREAILLINEIVSKRGRFSKEKLFLIVCDELEKRMDDATWSKKIEDAKLETTKQIKQAIDAYIDAINRDEIKPDMMQPRNVSDGAINIIGEVAQKINSRNRMEILRAVCEKLEKRFEGNTLEYHLRQMNIYSTDDLLYAIDIYNIGREYKIFDKYA